MIYLLSSPNRSKQSLLNNIQRISDAILGSTEGLIKISEMVRDSLQLQFLITFPSLTQCGAVYVQSVSTCPQFACDLGESLYAFVAHSVFGGALTCFMLAV